MFTYCAHTVIQMSDDEFYLEDSEEEEEEEEEGGFESDDGLQFSGEEGVDSVAGTQSAPRTSSHQTLTPGMISKKMFEIIDEVNAVFQVCLPILPLLCIPDHHRCVLSPSSFLPPTCASCSPPASGIRRSSLRGTCVCVCKHT